MNKESNRKVRIKVRLSEEENEKLKRCAAACGLSQSAFIRQLCKGKAPKPQPQKEFWEVLEALYSVHNSFKSCAKFEPSALEICKEIEGSDSRFTGGGIMATTSLWHIEGRLKDLIAYVENPEKTRDG